MTAKTNSTIVAVFRDRAEAQQAINELKRAGFREDQIGVTARDGKLHGAVAGDGTGDNYAAEAATAGLATGVFRSISSSRHADTITPADPLNAVAVSFNGNGLPQKRGGSASAISLFEACSVFTRVSACLVARSPEVTRYTRVLQQICYLLYRPGCFRPSDRLTGRDSHPLDIANFHGIHVFRESR